MRARHFIALLVIFAMAGCHPKQTVLGNWVGTMPMGLGTADVKANFTDDGHFTIEVKRSNMTTEQSGQYKYDETKGTMDTTVEKIMRGGKPVGMNGPGSKHAVISVTWKTPDTITMEAPDGSNQFDLTREKN